jgi:hypothetical protein
MNIHKNKLIKSSMIYTENINSLFIDELYLKTLSRVIELCYITQV